MSFQFPLGCWTPALFPKFPDEQILLLSGRQLYHHTLMWGASRWGNFGLDGFWRSKQYLSLYRSLCSRKSPFPALVPIQKCGCLASHLHPAFFKGREKEELRAPSLSSQNILRGSQLSWFFNRNPGLSTLEKSDVWNAFGKKSNGKSHFLRTHLIQNKKK